MNVEVETLPNCVASLHVELPSEQVSREWNAVAQTYRQAARIPGFRPGKAPQSVVEAKFKKEIQEELKRKLVNDTTSQVIREKGLKVLSVENVDDIEINPDRSMRFTATLITAPEFDLPEYKGITVKLPDAAVTEEEYEGALQNLREKHATFRDLESGELTRGGFAVIDFTGTVDGQGVTEVEPTAPKLLNGREDFWIRAEPEAILPGFTEALLGLRAGEKTEFDLPIYGESNLGALINKTVHFQVEVKTLKAMDLPALDDDFASQVVSGMTLNDLKTAIRTQLETSKAEQIESAKRGQVVDFLVQRVECELPQSYVRNETRRIMSEIVQQNQQRGVSEEILRENGKNIVTTASRNAKDRLKANFILNRIAEKEEIKVDPDAIKDRIAGLATQRRTTFEKMYAELDQKGLLTGVYEELLVAKVLDFLTSNATVDGN